MNNLIILILILVPNFMTITQSKKVIHPDLVSEAEIFIDESSQIRYSDLITLKFKEKIVDIKPGLSKLELADINNQKAKEYFKKILENYGQFDIVKLIPSAVWGDTLALSKRTGNTIHIPDWSQVIQLKFKNLVPIDIIIIYLQSLSVIEYAEEPFQACLMIEPNDEKYISGNNWAFTNIKAEEAWSISQGNSSIKIAILDLFGNCTSTNMHDDLIGKVDSHFGSFGNHGQSVAGIAGAKTNNEIGIASLGWNLHLRFYNMLYSVPEILRAVSDGADVINFSWVYNADFKSLRDAIKTALANGVVCVAASGNNQNNQPEKVYPAAYNFGELGQVIAVSATEYSDKGEGFNNGWNYSPGQNPLIDPEEAFIDVAAPGRDICVLDDKNSTGYLYGCGTSLSAPFVKCSSWSNTFR